MQQPPLGNNCCEGTRIRIRYNMMSCPRLALCSLSIKQRYVLVSASPSSLFIYLFSHHHFDLRKGLLRKKSKPPLHTKQVTCTFRECIMVHIIMVDGRAGLCMWKISRSTGRYRYTCRSRASVRVDLRRSRSTFLSSSYFSSSSSSGKCRASSLSPIAKRSSSTSCRCFFKTFSWARLYSSCCILITVCTAALQSRTHQRNVSVTTMEENHMKKYALPV